MTNPTAAAVYPSADVCRLAGVSPRQLGYWARTGVLTPTAASTGSGRPRGWSVAEVRRAWVLGRLTEGTAWVRATQPAGSTYLRSWGAALVGMPLDGGWLVVGKGSVSWVATVGEVPAALGRAGGVARVLRLAGPAWGAVAA